jgi:uncharacterized protein DUF2188
MTKTVHVFPSGKGWAVKQEGTKSGGLYSTQKQAIESARLIAKESAPSQMVVYGRDGLIKKHVTHGLPRVQDPPGASRRSKEIERAVVRVVLEHVTSDLHPPRG